MVVEGSSLDIDDAVGFTLRRTWMSRSAAAFFTSSSSPHI